MRSVEVKMLFYKKFCRTYVPWDTGSIPPCDVRKVELEGLDSAVTVRKVPPCGTGRVEFSSHR